MRMVFLRLGLAFYGGILTQYRLQEVAQAAPASLRDDAFPSLSWREMRGDI